MIAQARLVQNTSAAAQDARRSICPPSARPALFLERRNRPAFSPDAVRLLEDIRDAADPEVARAAAVRLVTLLTPQVAPAPATARGGLAPWQTRKLDRYLNEHLASAMHLEELADQVSLSVSYFCRAFKETFGDTPHEYIIGLRLERARRLMLSTTDSLSQIALACGFADQAHFCKLFRRGTGEAPSAWRRRNLGDPHTVARRHGATVG